MIEIKNLYKAFDDNVIFNNLNLTIDNGTFSIFSGPSGKGKTTLLNMIGALETIDKGSIIVDGIDISNKKTHLNYFRNKVGFLFQNFALIDNKTVKENLNLIRKENRSEISIEDALNFVGLSNKIDKRIYTLSGGEQQRVAIARLMIKKCDLILADEPTGSLDKKNSKMVMDILKKLNSQGKTILLVTHDEFIKEQGDILIEL